MRVRNRQTLQDQGLAPDSATRAEMNAVTLAVSCG
ncbi:MAG: hypothetical protein QOH53_2467 [Ilumatobacteraceae bacterium]|jgi:hypothetical protein